MAKDARMGIRCKKETRDVIERLAKKFDITVSECAERCMLSGIASVYDDLKEDKRQSKGKTESVEQVLNTP